MLRTITNNLSIISNCLKIQYIICGCFLFAITSIQAQQEVMYSQYMSNMININPAYTGNRAGDNITSLYRKQWVNIEGAPTTYSLSWDRGSNDVGLGLHQSYKPVSYGIQLYSDRLGVENSTGFQAFYAYRININRSFFSFGVSAGAMNYRAAFSQVAATHGGDPMFQEDVNAWLPTAGVGALFATMNWYVGLSVPAMLQTKVKNNTYEYTTGANSHYFLTSGYIFDASNVLKLKPSVMLKGAKGETLHCDLNLNAWINNLVGLGISYRTNNAVVGMFEIRVVPQVTIGYAYDYLTTKLKTFSTGSHELMLKFEFNRPENQYILSPRYY